MAIVNGDERLPPQAGAWPSIIPIVMVTVPAIPGNLDVIISFSIDKGLIDKGLGLSLCFTRPFDKSMGGMLRREVSVNGMQTLGSGVNNHPHPHAGMGKQSQYILISEPNAAIGNGLAN